MTPCPPDAAAAPVAAARRIAPLARSLAAEGEAQRHLSRAVVDAAVDAGLVRLTVPAAYGGGEAHPATVLACIEEVAAGDGAAGWCLMIAAMSGVVSAYLPPEDARLVYGDPASVTGGVFAPKGTAERDGGAFRVSGRWQWASGMQHCTWLMGGCRVVEGGAVRSLPSGAPDPHLLVFPAGEAAMVDTWRASGLRGTGSHDMVADAVAVPEGRAVSPVTARPVVTGPLYALPMFGLLAAGIAAVAIGIARAAVDELVGFAGGKTPTMSSRPLAGRAAVQADVARAEYLTGSARSFLLDTVGQAWDVAAAGGECTPAARARLRIAAAEATTAAARAVDLAYHAGGGTSVFDDSPLQRCFRDVHVATQHALVGGAVVETAGRVLLGLETDVSLL